MNQTMRQDAYYIIGGTLKAVLPDEAVRRVLENRTFPGRVVLAAA